MVFTEQYKRVLDNRVALNKAILNNPYWFLPVDDKGFEMYEPVGRGTRTSEFCGRHLGLMVCDNVEGHRDYGENKVVVKHKHWWCHHAPCPVCFIRGFAVRAACRLVGRVEKGESLGFGEAEHIVVSIPREDWGLSDSERKKKCEAVLRSRGITGGAEIFHGYRIDRDRLVLRWGVHYHVIGFVQGGYDRCRECVHHPYKTHGQDSTCKACDGFENRERQLNKHDNYIVSVKGKRLSLFGTAWYQLHHATVRVSAFKRFFSVTYFGVLGNRKFKSAVVRSEDKCPVCGEEMERCVCVTKRIPSDLGDGHYQEMYVDDLMLDGQLQYPTLTGGRE